MKHIITALFLLQTGMLMSSCVTSPYNGEPVGAPGHPIDVQGFALTPNEPLEIQAYDKSDGDWVTVGTTTSSETVTWTITNVEIYAFNKTITLDYTLRAMDNCFYAFKSNFGCYQYGYPQLRVLQPDGNYTYTTFEKDGIDCVMDELGDGKTLPTAVHDCASPDTPVLTLPWVW
jgi:hypothetical protein